VHLADGLWLTLRAARPGEEEPREQRTIAVTIEETAPGERLAFFGRAFARTARERSRRPARTTAGTCSPAHWGCEPGGVRLRNMRISVSSDMDEPVARSLVAELARRGHEVVAHGALRPGEDPQWAACSEAAAREVAAGTADQAVVCCWTGTGASIAANKVPGVRAALCTDAYTADGARRWNDANVLALSLRLTSEPLLKEILDAWFAAQASKDAEDRENVERVGRLDVGRTAG
jgi:RpiB/LacA/LacB family sugar-phosphate isomerase